MHVDAPNEDRRTLVDHDLDLHVTPGAEHTRCACPRAVVPLGSIVPLDSLEIALEDVTVEDLVVFEHAGEETEETRSLAASDVLLELVVVELVIALQRDAIERVALVGNAGAPDEQHGKYERYGGG